MDKWTAVDDSKLKDAVHTHGDKDWVAIARLVLGLFFDQTTGRKGYTHWPSDEDDKLKDAVHIHGGQNWAAIAGAGSASNESTVL
jgi:hypothetical protein